MSTKKTKTEDNSNKPWISNYPPLKEWLEKHDCHPLWQVPGSERPRNAEWDWSPQFYIECWRAAGIRPFIIIVRADKMGWDICTSADTAKIDETLADAEKRLGLATEEAKT